MWDVLALRLAALWSALWPLLGYQVAVVPVLLWAWTCWQLGKRARLRQARQVYRQRTGLLLILAALLSAALLHAPALWGLL